MKRVSAPLLLLNCALLCAAGNAPPAADPVPVTEFGDPLHGQTVFAEKGCVQCHAVRGAGGRIAPDLGRRASPGSYYEIASVMWSHYQGMLGKIQEQRLSPPRFEEGELSDLISFLYFLNYFDEPGDALVGRGLFREKGCIRCHRVEGEGGDLGPSLESLPRGLPPLSIAQSLWNHGTQMTKAIEASDMPMPELGDDEIIDLFAYVRSHGRRQSARRFTSPGDPAEGRLVFKRKGCGMCHAMLGQGGGAGPDLGRVELRGSVTQIAGRMWNHWTSMADAMDDAGMAVPTFEGDEMLDLFAYIYIARYGGEPGDARRGAEVFESKGCGVCHGTRGEGNPIAPALAPLAAQAVGEAEVMRRMWNHAPAMVALLEGNDMSWVRLTADQLADLLALLSSGFPAMGEGGDSSGR